MCEIKLKKSISHVWSGCKQMLWRDQITCFVFHTRAAYFDELSTSRTILRIHSYFGGMRSPAAVRPTSVCVGGAPCSSVDSDFFILLSNTNRAEDSMMWGIIPVGYIPADNIRWKVRALTIFLKIVMKCNIPYSFMQTFSFISKAPSRLYAITSQRRGLQAKLVCYHLVWSFTTLIFFQIKTTR